jgi:hypothetical protein
MSLLHTFGHPIHAQNSTFGISRLNRRFTE